MYKTITRALHERKALIEHAVKAAKEFYQFYEYQNKRTDLSVIRLDLGVPIYRLMN